MIAWDLPLGSKLAGLATGKPNSLVTLHLLKAAAKSSRLDEAGLKKRASTRGDGVVDVKPGDAVLGLTAVWTVDRFVNMKAEGTKREKKEDSPKPEQLELLSPAKKPVKEAQRPQKLPPLPNRLQRPPRNPSQRSRQRRHRLKNSRHAFYATRLFCKKSILTG